MYHKPNLLQHQRTRFLEAVFNTNSPSVTLNTLTSYKARRKIWSSYSRITSQIDLCMFRLIGSPPLICPSTKLTVQGGSMATQLSSRPRIFNTTQRYSSASNINSYYAFYYVFILNFYAFFLIFMIVGLVEEFRYHG